MQDGHTALIVAAQKGQLQTVQELLKHGANKDAKTKVVQGGGVGGGVEGGVRNEG